MDFTTILKTVAPWIGTALGGPLGGLAVDTATKALGIDDKTADGLKNALAGVSAEDMLKLKQADQAFQAQMQELGYKSITDLEQIAAGDRASARDLQKTVRSWVPSALAMTVTTGFIGILGGSMFGLMKLGDSQAMLLLLGSLSTGWGQILAYYFGSTAGSSEKTRLLAQSSPTK